MLQMLFILMGWIKLNRFCELTGLSETAVKQRITSASYPEWQVGGNFVKLTRDGYYINWEKYQEYMNQLPANFRLAS